MKAEALDRLPTNPSASKKLRHGIKRRPSIRLEIAVRTTESLSLICRLWICKLIFMFAAMKFFLLSHLKLVPPSLARFGFQLVRHRCPTSRIVYSPRACIIEQLVVNTTTLAMTQSVNNPPSPPTPASIIVAFIEASSFDYFACAKFSPNSTQLTGIEIKMLFDDRLMRREPASHSVLWKGIN